MSEVRTDLAVKMVRGNLENLPEFVFPPGLSLRWYRPGDEALWRQIHLAADHLNRITSDLFLQQFGSDTALLTQRQCYLFGGEGEAIGTGTAWFDDQFEGARYGRVHWIAIVPGYQGRGLGKPLLAAVCQRLRQLGHDRAYLSTSTARLPAIKLYLRFGFAPLIRSEAEDAFWRGILG